MYPSRYFTIPLKALFKNCYLDLFYPSYCLECQVRLSDDYKILCKACFDALPFTSVEEYCKRCFSPVETNEDHPFCEQCFKKPSPFFRILAPLELGGSALPLYFKLHQLTTSFLVKGLSSLLMLYLIEQKIPRPDLLIPLPSPFLKKLFGQINPAYEIAKTISHLWDIPETCSLSCFQSGNFVLKKTNSLADRHVLLVGEQLTPEFFAAGEALIAGYPKSIMGACLFTT